MKMRHYKISSAAFLPDTEIRLIMNALQVDDSFQFPCFQEMTVRNAGYDLAPKRFSVHRLSSMEARVWRIE